MRCQKLKVFSFLILFSISKNLYAEKTKRCPLFEIPNHVMAISSDVRPYLFRYAGLGLSEKGIWWTHYYKRLSPGKLFPVPFHLQRMSLGQKAAFIFSHRVQLRTAIATYLDSPKINVLPSDFNKSRGSFYEYLWQGERCQWFKHQGKVDKRRLQKIRKLLHPLIQGTIKDLTDFLKGEVPKPTDAYVTRDDGLSLVRETNFTELRQASLDDVIASVAVRLAIRSVMDPGSVRLVPEVSFTINERLFVPVGLFFSPNDLITNMKKSKAQYLQALARMVLWTATLEEYKWLQRLYDKYKDSYDLKTGLFTNDPNWVSPDEFFAMVVTQLYDTHNMHTSEAKKRVLFGRFKDLLEFMNQFFPVF
jgi:hypothetical protein